MNSIRDKTIIACMVTGIAVLAILAAQRGKTKPTVTTTADRTNQLMEKTEKTYISLCAFLEDLVDNAASNEGADSGLGEKTREELGDILATCKERIVNQIKRLNMLSEQEIGR